MDDIDILSRKSPCLCKVAPNTQKYHIQDVNRAGGIMGIMGQLAKAGLIDTSVARIDGMTLGEAIDKYDITSPNVCEEAIKKYKSAAAGSSIWCSALRTPITKNWIRIVPKGAFAIWNMHIAKTEDWPY